MKCPDIITEEVLTFVDSIVRGVEPVYICCEPLVGKPSGECFLIVDEHVARFGGSRELGWSIYHWPNVFIEGELHAVWVAPDGTRKDIAPHQAPLKQILFLPDPAIAYRDNCQVNNHRMALNDDPLIGRFIQAANDIFAEENRGEFASLGHFVATESWHQAQRQKMSSQMALMKKYGMPPGTEDLIAASCPTPMQRESPKIGRNDPCLCGSGKKFKKCCGARI
jgi:hypothetical protein